MSDFIPSVYRPRFGIRKDLEETRLSLIAKYMRNTHLYFYFENEKGAVDWQRPHFNDDSGLRSTMAAN